jgi:hypothetical protein
MGLRQRSLGGGNSVYMVSVNLVAVPIGVRYDAV